MKMEVDLVQITLKWDIGRPVQTQQGEPIQIPMDEFLTRFIGRLAGDLADTKALVPAVSFWDRIRNNMPKELVLDKDVRMLVERASEEALADMRAATIRGDLK